MIVLRSDSGETHVRRHATWGMYDSIKALNPNGIVPAGPDLPGLAPVAPPVGMA